MKPFLAAMALACVLSVSALAGEIPTSGITSPTPGGTAQTTSDTSPGGAPSAPGDLPTGGFAQQVSDAALSALMTMLGLVIV